MAETGIHEFGPVTLQRGGRLPALRLAFAVHGTLDAARRNAVLFPTWFGGQDPANAWLIGPGRALDPRRYCIIVVNIIGNGRSSSPSNTDPPFDRARFPEVTILDNAVLQRRLLRERFGVDRLALVLGRSMGAQIAFQFAAAFPDEVDRLLAICGSARTAAHNFVFLESLRQAITGDPAWRNGDYDVPPAAALRLVQVIFDGWGYSQAWYREGLHLRAGHASTADFVRRPVQDPERDVNDLLAQIDTWQRADISDNEIYQGNLAAALGAIRARAIVMPCRTDLYFPAEDSAREVAQMPNATLRILPSVWGHRAGAPGTDPADIAALDHAVADILAEG